MSEQQKNEQRTITWLHLGVAFGGLLIVIISMWVDVNSKISAMGQYIEDNKDSQKQILQSIENLRTIQMQEIEKIGELKGAFDYQQKYQVNK